MRKLKGVAMDETAVNAARYAGRLMRESAKLGFRLFGILGGVAAESLWEATKHAAKEAPLAAAKMDIDLPDMIQAIPTFRRDPYDY